MVIALLTFEFSVQPAALPGGKMFLKLVILKYFQDSQEVAKLAQRGRTLTAGFPTDNIRPYHHAFPTTHDIGLILPATRQTVLRFHLHSLCADLASG